jgi:hypothetical protein
MNERAASATQKKWGGGGKEQGKTIGWLDQGVRGTGLDWMMLGRVPQLQGAIATQGAHHCGASRGSEHVHGSHSALVRIEVIRDLQHLDIPIVVCMQAGATVRQEGRMR